MKELFKNEEYLERFYNTLKETVIDSPNKQERIVLEILESLYLTKYKFVGNFSIWIDGKNPDFINEKDKKIIEFFGSHWHKDEDEKIRKDHFEKNGYKTLIVWDHELKNLEKVKDKIILFQEGNTK